MTRQAQIGDLVKVFTPAVRYTRQIDGDDKEKYTAPFQVGIFLGDYYEEYTTDDGINDAGEWRTTVFIEGQVKDIRAKSAESL